jgi:hypothetical protein
MAARSPNSRGAAWHMCLMFLLCSLSWAEIQDFQILMPPTELYVHYADGYVIGPGASIDLSELVFTAVSEAHTNTLDDAMNVDDATRGGTANGSGSGGGRRRLLHQDVTSAATSSSSPSSSSSRHLDGGVELDASYLDIVVFHQPDECASSRTGCDWDKLGVGGNLGANGGLRWCCSQATSDAGLCDGSDYRQWQRLIINQTLFQGTIRSIIVPRDGTMSKKLRSGKIELEESGRYAVLFANCNEQGRDVMVAGDAYWKSKHGYLPGELFQFMPFWPATLSSCYGFRSS